MAMNPAMKKWNEHVMTTYRAMKKRSPSTRLGDAMKAAKKTWKSTRKATSGGKRRSATTRKANRRH